MSISPSCLDIQIAKSESDKITVLKKRIESINALVELRKRINEIANQIAENSALGYAAIKLLPELMQESERAECLQNDSISTEKFLDLRIEAFKKARDLHLDIAQLTKFGAPESQLAEMRVAYSAAAAHAIKILKCSLDAIYSYPDQDTAPVDIKPNETAPVEEKRESGKADAERKETTPADEKHESSKADVKPEKSNQFRSIPLYVPRKIMDAEHSYARMVAKMIGLDKSEVDDYRVATLIDYMLIESCSTNDVLGACKAINSGATDFNAGLAFACFYGHPMRALHLIKLGATDVQLGLLAGLCKNNFEIIDLMLANGAKVTDDVIMYATTLKNDSIKKIVFPGSNNISYVLAAQIWNDASISREVRDYVISCKFAKC